MVSTSQSELPEFRARRAGEIIDAAVKLYFARWKTFIPLAAVFMVPLAAVSAIAGTASFSQMDQPSFTDPEAIPSASELVGAFAPIALVGLLSLLIFPLVTGATAWAAAQFYLGDNPSVGRIVKAALSRFGALVLVTILTGVLALAGFILLVIPGIIVVVRLLLASPAVMVEDNSATDAMRRSWRLVKGFFWKAVGVSLLTSLIGVIVQSVFDIPFNVYLQYLYEQQNWAAAAVVAFIGQSISTTLITPFGAIVYVLLYFDLRIRKEGMDLSLMAENLRSDPQPGGPAPG